MRFYADKLDSLFGGLLFTMLVAAGIFLLCYGRKITTGHKDSVKAWLMLLVPCALYFLTISKIAVMQSERYISPVYSISIILMTGGIKRIADLGGADILQELPLCAF